MQTDENSRVFPVSKEVLDTVNSLFWFGADASWMMESLPLSASLMVPTILTGLMLLYIEKRKSVLAINVAINCWIMMNLSWILSDIYPESMAGKSAKMFFAMGILSVIVAAATSNNLQDTFSHFRRFRALKK
jgi:hypothetical protein